MFVYNILLSLLAPLIILGYIFSACFTGKRRKGFFNSIGFLDNELKGNKGQKSIWVYALSVGEVKAVIPVLKEIRRKCPSLFIAVSVTTDAGFLIAERDMPFVDLIFYHPIDLMLIVRRVFSRLSPEIIIITETGFWPNFISEALRRGIPAILIHGRISKKSADRYRYIKPFFTSLMNRFDTLILQNEINAERFKGLGIDELKIKVMGDTKYDALPDYDSVDYKKILLRFNIKEGSRVIIAGSTHEGEEEVIVKAFLRLKKGFGDNLYLIIAPRRVERADEICSLLNKEGLNHIKRSDLANKNPVSRVIVIDIIGELASLYSIASVVFIGRSLFPPGGGHSLIEPVAFGKPVLHGPYVEYNQETANLLNKSDISFIVCDEYDIINIISKILHNTERLNAIFNKSQKLIKDMRGASNTICSYLLGIKNLRVSNIDD